MNAIASPVLTPDVCEILRAEAFAAFKSLPRRGAEIGGFLTKSGNSAEEFLADGAEFVACEHLFGPSYHLSPSDLDSFRQRAERSELVPAGYFRSCTRQETRVEPEDLEVLRTAVPGGNCIVLLKPFPNGNCEVKIFTGENLDLVSDFELKMNLAAMPEPEEEEPVEAIAMAQPPRPAWTAGPAADPVSTPPLSATDTVREMPMPEASVLPSRRLVHLVAGALLAIALVVAGITWWRQRPQPAISGGSAASSSASSALGMRVERQTDNFRVTWNRDLPALRRAIGSLTIDDGRQPRELQLDGAQIASGSVVYVSDAGDLTFRMKVRGEKGRETTESVRVVVAGRPPQPGASPSSTDAGAATVEAKKERQVVPGIRAWASAIPRIATYRPAIPVRRIKPEIPSSLVRRRSVVEVMVRVDAGGRVTEAHAVGTGNAVPEMLATHVVDASRQWTFEPAKVHGRGVPSDYMIVYSFNPAGL